MARDYPERPLVGVGVLVWRDDRLLLVRRGRPPQGGEWSIPGGGQEVGETLFDAAQREALEETGVTVLPTAVVTAVDSIHRDAEDRVQWHYTIVDVEAEWLSGEPVAGDDAAEVRWATVAEADDLVEWPELRRVITLAAAQRKARRNGTPRLRTRPAITRLMRSPLGSLIARPWLDELSLKLVGDWVFPMSRAWAAAMVAEGDVGRFCDEVPIAQASVAKSGWLSGALAEVTRCVGRHDAAEAAWAQAVFSTASPLAEAVAAEDARLDAATALGMARLRFALFGHTRRIPACRWAIPTEGEVEARHGARLADLEGAYAMPAVLPPVLESRRLPGELGTEHWIRFPSPVADTPCWARVFTPPEAVDPPTVIHLHGAGMEPDHMRAPLNEVATYLELGLRVVVPEAPGHGRRRPPGRYSGEPMIAASPLGSLDHFAAHVRELGVMTAWAHRTSRGAVGWSGISLGALTSQLAASHAAAWPAECRAEALLLFATSEGLDEIALTGALARAFGVDRQLQEHGWTVAALNRWRPLTDPLAPPATGARNVFMVLGSEDTVTPVAGGLAIAERWGVPAEQVHVRRQGHFSVPAGLLVDEAPLTAFAQRLLSM